MDNAAAVVGEWERLRRQIRPLLRDRQQITMAAEVRAAGGKCWAATGS